MTNPLTNQRLRVQTLLCDLKVELMRAGEDELAAIIDQASREVHALGRPLAKIDTLPVRVAKLARRIP